ncbi:actin-related protein, putative [Babesia bigemina]|uniref:Actin-related protein, putative n=1 Tax=Babesia bigemina TaxID=5866 RepID=A0A061D7L0_BABBI|nr:actin-related protein, putative [Babesia bigemina]CDR93710.1 actin-related protein, putative [Babesia bigemina]|eukprot:XP_012765896.1 actin-related protein, putative [Babesia bigemina]
MTTKPFIVDFGTVTVRVGRVGEKIPPFIAPPYFGQPNLKVDQAELCDFSGGNVNNWLDYAIFPLNPREKHDNTLPIPAVTYEQGRYKLKYSVMDKLLECAAGSKFVDDIMEGGAVIATEPNIHSPEFRKTMAEILIEGQRVDKFYMCKRAALSCYATGKGSAVVVDVGGACSNVTVVSDGYVLQETIQEQPMGGTLLDRILLGHLNRSGTKIRPSFEYIKASKSDDNAATKYQKKNNEARAVSVRQLPFVREEYYDYARLYATSRVKETCCIMGEKLEVDVEASDSCFALPDGSYIDTEMGKAMCGVFCCCIFSEPEYLQDVEDFNAFQLETLPKLPKDPEQLTLGQTLRNLRGLDVLLANSYSTAAEMEPAACLPEALRAVIMSDVEQPLYMAVGGDEQQYSSFIGASILGSLGLFESLCVSREECQEHGFERILQRKCP